jgi:ABC transporter DrrB family efflux protein
MSTATTAPSTSVPSMSSDADTRPRPVADAMTIAWRNLMNVRRNPQLVAFMIIQPIMLVLMFRYVFGGVIRVPGVDYVNFLMPGIFVQTVLFGAVNTGIGLAEDLQKGLVDRFRSLPMARSAVLVGRTLADMVRNTFAVILMCTVGFIVGWHPDGSPIDVLVGIFLVVLFAYSLSWFFAILGLATKSAEIAQAASFPLMMPLVFASAAFAPTESMPGWLKVFAEHQPVTAVVNAVRALTLGADVKSYIVSAIGWIIGITVVCATISIRLYRRVD